MTAREIDMLREFIREEFRQVNERLDQLGQRLAPLEIERQQRIGATAASRASSLTQKERLGLIVAVIGGAIGFIAQVIVPLVVGVLKAAPTH